MAAELEKALCDLKATKDALEVENDILQQRCSDLYQSLLQAQEERSKSCEELTKVQADLDRVKRDNVHLWQYMDNLSEQEGFKNCGKAISEVKGRQQRRKVRELKTYVEKALWFAETFGLKLSSVEFAGKDGKSHTIDYQVDLDRKKSYTELSEEEQIKVQQVLFITDKFCIGEAAYHELTMTDGGTGLPRSYLLKQCKTQLNSLCHIRRTLGEDEGAQLDLLPELKNTIAKQIDLTKFQENPNCKLRIKISGDGAKMTRITSFVIMSFSLLDSDDVMSSKGSHTVAVVKGHESYDLLKSSFSDLFKAINGIAKYGKISVNGLDIPIDVLLGGDYKFLLLLLGMKGATSDHACIWCTIHKGNGFDMSKPEDFYSTGDMSRTLEQIKKCALQTKLSCVHLA